MGNRIKAKIIDKIYRALNKDGFGSDTANLFMQGGCVDEQSVKPNKNNYKRGYRLELIKKGILIDENRGV